MAKTVIFDRFQEIIFPHLCAGCLMPLPHSEIWITTGKGKGKSVVGKLALKGAHLATWSVFGAIGATALDYLTGRSDVTAVFVPVCEECLEALSPEEKKQLEEASKKEPGDFFVSSVKNRIFSCKVKANKVYLTLEKDLIATALAALNKDVVREEGVAIPDAPCKPEERNVPSIPIPTLDAQTREKYVQTYKRELKAVDLAIIDSWHRIVGKQHSIHSYPDIPGQKLSNAKTSYAALTPDDIIIGLQDSTDFGSAKKGALLTTRSMYWKDYPIGGETGHISFAEVDPSQVRYKYGWAEKSIIIGDKKILLGCLGSEKTLKALASFIIEAALLLRESPERQESQGESALDKGHD